MASIQQSLNQLLGAAAGAATAGSYMIRQSDMYKAAQLDKKAEKLEEYTEAIDVEDEGEAYEESRQARVEAAKLSPTKKRTERAMEIFGERVEEEAFPKRQEVKRAQQTVREMILSQEMYGARDQQTLKFQEALETIRSQKKGGMN